MKYAKEENWDQRVEEAVAGCDKCDGNPPAKNDLDDHPGVEDLFDDIADIIDCENAGSKTDFDYYPFYIFELVKLWRETELAIEEKRELRFDSFIRSWIKQ